MSANSKPKLPHLLEYLDPIKGSWKHFGTFLEIHANKIEAIDKDSHSSEEKLREVCIKWLQVNPDGTWEDVIEALEKIERYDAIKDIKETLFHEGSTFSKKRNKKRNKKKMKDASPSHHSCKDSDMSISSDHSTKKVLDFNPHLIIGPLLSLYGKFIYILSNMQTDLNRHLENKKLTFEQFNRFVCNFFSIELRIIQITQNDKIDALFRSLDLSCFDTYILCCINDNYLDTKYEGDILAYDNDLDKFEKEKSILDLKDMVEKCQYKKSESTIVVLKLGRFWNDRNVKNLNHLVKHLFGHSDALLTLVRIHHSTLTVIYKAPKWALLSLIVSVAKVKDDLLFVGIHSIQIGTILLNLVRSSIIDPDQRLLERPVRSPQAIKLLFNIGANINITNQYGVTPVHIAAGLDMDHALRMLLSLGANPNTLAITLHHSESPLLAASRFGFSHCVFLLLYHGGNPNIRHSKNV